MLEVRVLGGLSAAVGGSPVDLPADAKARELLAFLAVRPGPHERSALAGMLRPDVPEASARKTLRDAVYELRLSLGGEGREAVRADRERVGLEPDSVSVDVLAFRRARDSGDHALAAQLGDGVLLPGMEAEWARGERDAHEEARLEVLNGLIDEAEGRAAFDEAVRWSRRLVEVDPLSETSSRRLVRALALAGDRAAALTAAETLEERLRSELRLAPSPETRALVEEVRRGAVAAPAEAVRVPLPSRMERSVEPVGRAAAIARLDRSWNGALGGDPHFVAIAGEPGIGKTTLAGAFGRKVHAAGATVLLGRCDERILLPYGPWAEALDPLLEAAGPDGRESWLEGSGGALRRLLPGGGDAEPSDRPDDRYLAFEVVRRLLEAAAAEQPLLLWIDDLHWSDDDSLALLRHLARSASGRVLVVISFRAEELPTAAADVIADIRREAPLETVRLEGLSEDAVSELAERFEADLGASEELRDRTGGNPLFLTEMLLADEEGSLPAGIREVIGRRLERLGPEVGDALGRAAVLSDEVTASELAELNQQNAAETLDRLEAATGSGLMVDDGSGRYSFRHALIRETARSRLSAGDRAQLHLDAARLLQARDDRAGAIALHLRQAGPLADPAELARWEIAAARGAVAGLAYADAAEHFRAALAAGTAVDGSRIELLLEAGDSFDRAGSREDARATFAEAAELARSAKDATAFARAALGYGGLGVVVSEPDAETVRLLEEAIPLTDGDPALSARLRARLAIELYYRADPVEVGELAEAGVEEARRSGDPGALVAALNGRRVARWEPGSILERLNDVEEMAAVAGEAGQREAELQARNWRVIDLWELGRIAEAEAEIEGYASLADEVGLPHFAWYSHLWRAGMAISRGEWNAVERSSAMALALGERAEDPNAPLLVRIQRQFVLELTGSRDAMDRDWYAERSASARDAAGDAYAGTGVRMEIIAGDLDAAREKLRHATRDGGSAIRMNANWLVACELAQSAAELEDPEAAAVLHGLLGPYAELQAVIGRGVGSMGSTELYLGSLAAVMGRMDEAEGRLRRSIERNEAGGAAIHSTQGRLRLGRALAERAAPESRELLTRAATEAEALGLRSVAREATDALAGPG